MIIENVEALKSWLSKLLEPICEADPSALSNYVVALVKKDKPEKDLKALCTVQLDVFLQKETVSFVEKLFDSLTTKNYLETLAKEVLTKGTKLPGGKHVKEEDGCRNCRRKRSPSRIHSDSNDSRTRDDRRIDDCKRWGEGHFRKRAEPRRVHHDLPTSRRRRRSRSRSRSSSRSGASGKTRSREGKSHRCREHRLKPDKQWKDLEDSAPVPGSCDPSKPQQQQQHSHLQPCFGGPVTPSLVAVATPAHLPDSTTENCHWSNRGEGNPLEKGAVLKQRCHDYTDKGLCVHGDLCPCDHGNDPSVVDDGTSLAVMRFPPPPGGPPAGTATPTGGPVPPLDSAPTPGGKRSEAYNSEVPGIVDLGRSQYKPLATGIVETNRAQGNPEVPGIVEPGRARQLIPRVHTPSPSSRAANIAAHAELNVSAMQDHGPGQSKEQENRKRPLGARKGPLPKRPWMDKINFSNQHKLSFQKSHYANTKLEVRKIPRDLNNIKRLNEHFSAFGTIVNIQVAFGGDPEAALIQYASGHGARRAIGGTEAVLNNRFIQVRWYRDSRDQDLRSPRRQSYSAPSRPQHASVHKVAKQQCHPGRYTLNHTVAKQASKPAARSVVPAPSVAMTMSACLQKMADTSRVMKSTSKTVGKVARVLEAREAMKKKQEALKLQQDMRKVRQRMLEKQIECQKVLINRLERSKAMKPEERAGIVKTLKELSEKICRLKEDVRSASVVATRGSVRSKREADTQKELLDAELDLHMKLVSGEDSSDLKKKLCQLQVEATHLRLLSTGVKAHSVQDRGWGARGWGGGTHLVVDHRPQTLTMPGVTSEDKAPNQEAKFKGRTLQMSWHKSEQLEPMKPEEDYSKEESVSSVLRPDEDDDDDDDDEDDDEDKHESRSWRR